jgi:hypothetical protein
MISEHYKELLAPFPPERVKARKQSGITLHYIDARTVMDRLDETVGPDNWSDNYRELDGRIICELTVLGVTKMDGAEDSKIEAKKGGLSDAFKRAAVKFGIGRYLYDGKNPAHVYNEYNNKSVTKPKAKLPIEESYNKALEVLATCDTAEAVENWRIAAQKFKGTDFEDSAREAYVKRKKEIR